MTNKLIKVDYIMDDDKLNPLLRNLIEKVTDLKIGGISYETRFTENLVNDYANMINNYDEYMGYASNWLEISPNDLVYFDKDLMSGSIKSKIVPEKERISYLFTPIKFNGTITFGRIFNLILESIDLITILYATDLNFKDLSLWQEEFQLEIIDEEDNESSSNESDFGEEFFSYIRFSWEPLEVETDPPPYVKHLPSADITLVKHYKPKHMSDDDLNEIENIFESPNVDHRIGYMPVNTLKSYPIMLDTNWILKVYTKEKNVIYNDAKIFSCHDLFTTILHEISYDGTPAERKQRKKSSKDETSNDKKSLSLEDFVTEVQKKISDNGNSNGS